MSYCVSWWSGPDQVLPDPRNIGEMGTIATAWNVFREAMESLYRSLPGKPATPADDPGHTDWFKELDRACQKREHLGEIGSYVLGAMPHSDFWHVELKILPGRSVISARLDVFLTAKDGVWQIDEEQAIKQQVMFGREEEVKTPTASRNDPLREVLDEYVSLPLMDAAVAAVRKVVRDEICEGRPDPEWCVHCEAAPCACHDCLDCGKDHMACRCDDEEASDG
jgi:hypothetical protein